MNAIFHGDCLDMLRRYVPESTVQLILTSPPYGNQRKQSYGGVEPAKYLSWFLKRAEEFKRVLTLDGSMVVNICPHVENGEVVEYVDDLVAALKETWFFKGIYYWRKTNPVPGKATYRLKNAIEPCYHFAVQKKPAFYAEQVKQPAKASSIERANRLTETDLERRQSGTGSGFGINMGGTYRNYYERKNRLTGSGVNFVNTPESICDADYMAYPDNVIECACEGRSLQRLYGDPRYDDDPKASACFPKKLPAFFIDLLTRKGDVVLDPFSGSGTTAKVAQITGRSFIAIEKEPANIHLIVNRLSNTRRTRRRAS